LALMTLSGSCFDFTSRRRRYVPALNSRLVCRGRSLTFRKRPASQRSSAACTSSRRSTTTCFMSEFAAIPTANNACGAPIADSSRAHGPVGRPGRRDGAPRSRAAASPSQGPRWPPRHRLLQPESPRAASRQGRPGTGSGEGTLATDLCWPAWSPVTAIGLTGGVPRLLLSHEVAAVRARARQAGGPLTW
jgi:hypothetical protein